MTRRNEEEKEEEPPVTVAPLRQRLVAFYARHHLEKLVPAVIDEVSEGMHE